MAGTQNYQNLPVLWTFVGLVFIFAGLRLYTRLSVVKQFGWDDHIYLAASVSADFPVPILAVFYQLTTL